MRHISKKEWSKGVEEEIAQLLVSYISQIEHFPIREPNTVAYFSRLPLPGKYPHLSSFTPKLGGVLL